MLNNRSAKTNLTIRFLSNTPTSNTLNKSSTQTLDPVMTKILGKSLLSSDEEIYEKYKEGKKFIRSNLKIFFINAALELVFYLFFRFLPID